MKGYIASTMLGIVLLTVAITRWFYLKGHLDYAFVTSMIGVALELVIIVKAFGKKSK